MKKDLMKKEVFFNEDHEEKSLLDAICKWKQLYPQMSFLDIYKEFKHGMTYSSVKARAAALETLFSGEDNPSNKIVNTMIQLIIDKGKNSYGTILTMIPTLYKGLNIHPMIGVLNEIIEVEFFIEELSKAGFGVIIFEGSVLLKMVKNYQERKALAMNGSLLIDKDFYNWCADNLD